MAILLSRRGSVLRLWINITEKEVTQKRLRVVPVMDLKGFFQM